MPRGKLGPTLEEVKALLSEDQDLLRVLVQAVLQELLEANLLERLNEEIKRRTQVVRIFPHAASCRRLIRARAVERHEHWLEAHRYLNMDDLREHQKEALRLAALWTTPRVAPKGPPPPP